MNPFTESTVARPLAESQFQSHRPIKHADESNHLAELPSQISECVPPKHLAGSAAAARPVKKNLLAVVTLACAGLVALGTLMVAPAAHATDVNLATADQLKDVRGIGPKTAQIIIEERSRGGTYESFTDLTDRVKGIGPKKAEALRHAGLTIGTQTTNGKNIASPPVKSSAK